VEKIEYNLTQAKQNNGQTRWHRVGQARKSDANFWVRLDVMPIANSDGEIWLNLFERTDDEISQKNAQGQKQETLHKNSHESSQR
jgi:hypothetical protein